MRVAVVGATGMIGRAVADAIEARHEVLRASRAGSPRVDIEDRSSVAAFYGDVADLDAVVCTAGTAPFGKLAEVADEGFELGLRSKLMGQVNLVRLGVSRLREGGCFLLTSGVLSHSPMPGSSVLSMVNAGVEAFARAAALELAPGLRINVVSPGWVKETMELRGMDSAQGMPVAELAGAYVAALEGRETGQVIAP